MSKKILQALMQLFAIISPLQILEKKDQRSAVKVFLERLLNQEQVGAFLAVFDGYYEKFISELSVRLKSSGDLTKEEIEKLKRRVLARRAVKVLTICESINQELTQSQKIIFLVQLLEFIKGDSGKISSQEQAYVDTVATAFNLPPEEYSLIRNFVLSDRKLADASGFLLIKKQKEEVQGKRVKHMVREQLQGEIRIIHVKSTDQFFMKFVGRAEVYMNGQLLKSYQSYPFTAGSSIRQQNVDPVYYSDVVSVFIKDKVDTKIFYEARDISHTFKNGNPALQEVNFTAQSGRMVGIMGASGSGKTTLMNALNGSVVPDEGQILINGIDIHSGDAALNGMIGFVAQDDLLIEELSVYQNLYYNARLCFSNYTEEELVKIVESTLARLGLLEIKDIQVGSPLNKKISGGQRKRLNIALELIREPAVLFLDEPTSGLSSRDSENIMDLLKELALKGKLVFVVIHQPSSQIFKMFDRLLILDMGGILIYNGNPVESIRYFKSKLGYPSRNASSCVTCGNVNPEQVFNIIETSVLNDDGKLSHTRKITPREWQMYFKNRRSRKTRDEATAENLPKSSFHAPGLLGQFLVFMKRDISKKLSDRQYLFINLLEAPVLAFLLAFLIKYHDTTGSGSSGYTLLDNFNFPIYIFMSVIVALFMGLSVSAEEIIKDRRILKREAFLNLSRTSYLLSKVGVQFMLSAFQALTFVLIGNLIMEIKGMFLIYWIILFSAWAFANLMGLLISDSFKSVVTIYILIPFLVIPQIVLSGVLVKFEQLNPQISSPKKIPFYGEIMTARWAYEALATYQFTENDYMKDIYHWEKVASNASFKSNFFIRDLQSKLSYIEQNKDSLEIDEQVGKYLEILRNELSDEYHERMIMHGYYDPTPTFSYPESHIANLYPDKLDDELISYTKDYLSSLTEFYQESSKLATDTLDAFLEGSDQEELRTLRKEHTNKRLEQFVTNRRTVERLLEYKGQLIQKTDMIYMDPTSRFVKAHFYAPRKMIFGVFFPTIWVNLLVIWIMTLITYLMLQFRVLKKFLDFLERITPTNSK